MAVVMEMIVAVGMVVVMVMGVSVIVLVGVSDAVMGVLMGMGVGMGMAMMVAVFVVDVHSGFLASIKFCSTIIIAARDNVKEFIFCENPPGVLAPWGERC